MNMKRITSIMKRTTSMLMWWPLINRIRIWRDQKSNSVSSKALAYINSLFGIESKDWGTIEGRLSVLSERRGLQILVYDPVTNQPTRCYFKEEILKEVLSAFGQRVSVSGLIRYRGGEPMNMKVEEFYIFPEPETLPGIMDIRGILKGSG